MESRESENATLNRDDCVAAYARENFSTNGFLRHTLG